MCKTVRDAEILLRNNVGGEAEPAVLERTVSTIYSCSYCCNLYCEQVWSLEQQLHPQHFLLAQVKLVLLTQYSLQVREESR